MGGRWVATSHASANGQSSGSFLQPAPQSFESNRHKPNQRGPSAADGPPLPTLLLQLSLPCSLPQAPRVARPELLQKQEGKQDSAGLKPQAPRAFSPTPSANRAARLGFSFVGSQRSHRKCREVELEGTRIDHLVKPLQEADHPCPNHSLPSYHSYCQP